MGKKKADEEIDALLAKLEAADPSGDEKQEPKEMSKAALKREKAKKKAEALATGVSNTSIPSSEAANEAQPKEEVEDTSTVETKSPEEIRAMMKAKAEAAKK